MENEAKMGATGRRVLGVSSTAPMQADQASLQRVAETAGQVIDAPARSILRAALRGGPASDEIAQETQSLLLDPNSQARLLQILAANNSAKKRAMKKFAPVLQVGNVLAGQSHRLNPYTPQQ